MDQFKKDEAKLQDTLAQMEERDKTEEELELVRENKMGAMPVGKLLANMSIPIIISMLVQALYNVVDSIFVARLGEDALAAVGLIFPIQNLMIAVIVGTGVGMSSRLSRRLGEQNIDSANRVAKNGLFLAVLSWLAFVVFGITCTNFFVSSFAQHPDSNLAVWAKEYMYIVTIFSLASFMSITLERLLQATGRTMYSMVSQITGAVVNVILDPIMIFGLLGFPAMGVAGAAWATIIGQIAAMCVGIWANLKKNKELNLNFRKFRPSLTTIRHIYQVGFPSIIMQSIGSVMTYGMNLILVTFGTTPVSVFSIYFKLQSFIFMPIFGLGSGMIPIIAFNYGAKKPQRIEKTIRISAVVAFCIMVFGTLLFWIAPRQLLGMFEAQESMMSIGVVALRIIAASFPLAAFSITFGGVFQALGKGTYSLAVSAIRQLVVLLPAAFILSRVGGLSVIWYAFPIAEVVCIFVSTFFFKRIWANRIKPLGAT